MENKPIFFKVKWQSLQAAPGGSIALQRLNFARLDGLVSIWTNSELHPMVAQKTKSCGYAS